ncbi:flavodoxin family protein [Nocardiopsis sp. N85]|uniref:flavodoxin family protein n=1 Tax=Nocardiopsis sp. N85 TaxID=3029400 RepID=UPI00237EFB47|nr:flavodoxin family protein [Nocardiopsis sp. N85]MDE3725047.1 flavodoxin family protein [Nocardiopsis sp. N85]
MSDVRVSVVFHSGYGHTARQAEAAVRGAEGTEGVRASLHDATVLDEGLWSALDAADAIVFGTPTYMGGVSAAFQTFAEATSSIWQRRGWQGKLAAGFTNSAGTNGNKDTVLSALAVFAAQHGMVWVPLGLLPGGEYSSRGHRDDLNRLGGFTGAMAQSSSDLGPDLAPAGSDLRTAEHLGAQVAKAALRFEHGRAAVMA